MEEVHKIIEEANQALMKSVEGLDSKLRPVQRSFFQCGLACTSDDKSSATEVGECIQKCQAPLARVQGLLREAQETFQTRMMRCHEAAGESLDPAGPAATGKPSAEEMRKYADALRPCMAMEANGVSELVRPVYAAVPQAHADIRSSTPEGKKGWF